MDTYSGKKNWKSVQLQNVQSYVDSNRRTMEFAPTIYVRDNPKCEYKAWGIKDYKSPDIGLRRHENISAWLHSKVGTLELPFPNGKILRVEKVHCVIISWGREHSSWGANLSSPMHQGIAHLAPDLKEMEELNFAVQTVDFNVSNLSYTSDILFYRGSTLVATVKNVVSMGDHHYGDIYYAVKRDNIFTHFIRDIHGNEHIIGRSPHTWVDCEAKRSSRIRKMADDAVKSALELGYYRFYYCSDPSTPGTVLESYLHRHYKPTKVDNYFGDDETCNYFVDVDVNDVELIVFLKYYGKFGYAIYGIAIDEYLPYLPYENANWWYYRSASQMNFHRKVLKNALLNNESVTEETLMLELEKERYRSQNVQEHVLFQLFRRVLPDVPEFNNSYHNWAKEEYRKEKDFLISNDKLNCIWKGEYQMYKFARELYTDAQYQYHAEWLGRQSLDVFIPSLCLGIEYQGEQHYIPISHFGGEDGFGQRVVLDERKRNICNEQKVLLLEWRYDEPLTKNALKSAIDHLLDNSR